MLSLHLPLLTRQRLDSSLVINFNFQTFFNFGIELKETFRGYKDIQDKSLHEFAGRERWLQLFDQPNPNFGQFTNVPGLEAYVEQNKSEIENLAKQDSIAKKVIHQFITPDHDELIQGLDQINPDTETQKIVMREKTQAQIFESINEKFGDRFMNFEDRVTY